MSDAASPKEQWSALTDGELDAENATRLLAQWPADPEAQRAWHLNHLIGDVMRSADLASAPAHDVAFLAGVRAALAREPVILAPAYVAPTTVSQPASRSVRRAWAAPAAVAAGFIAVVGALAVVQLGAPQADRGVAAAVPGSPTAVPVADAGVAAGRPSAAIASGRVIRDAQLDRYLAAHRQTLGVSALAVPGRLARAADVVILEER